MAPMEATESVAVPSPSHHDPDGSASAMKEALDAAGQQQRRGSAVVAWSSKGAYRRQHRRSAGGAWRGRREGVE
jgi:hypothetical protein